MVKGMKRFREHFAGFEDRYVLIGGAACDLAMEDAGLNFRATKDLDIVLCIEALDAAFVKAFWAFVKRHRNDVFRLFQLFSAETHVDHRHSPLAGRLAERAGRAAAQA